MGSATYISAICLCARRWYFLQRVDDDLSTDHTVLRSRSGALLHDSTAAVDGAARALGESLTANPLHIDDLDKVLAWCENPTSSSMDYGLLMSSWHTLIELGVVESPLDAEGGSLEPVFDRLHLNYAYQTTKEEPRHDLIWTEVELTLLAMTLRGAIHRLEKQLPSMARRQDGVTEV